MASVFSRGDGVGLDLLQRSTPKARLLKGYCEPEQDKVLHLTSDATAMTQVQRLPGCRDKVVLFESRRPAESSRSPDRRAGEPTRRPAAPLDPMVHFR